MDLDVHQIPVSLGETPVKLFVGGIGFSIKAGLEPMGKRQQPLAQAPAGNVAQAPAQSPAQTVAQAPASCSPIPSKTASPITDLPSYLRPTATTQAKSKNGAPTEATPPVNILIRPIVPR